MIARRLVSLGVAVLTAAGCAGFDVGPWPFPALDPAPGPDAACEVVAQRAAAVRSLTAVLQAELRTLELSGSIDLVCIYERPGKLHLSGFKGLLLSTRPLFELTFTPRRYRLVLHDEDGGAETHDGELERFALEHADFAGVFWLREVLFLPGQLDRDRPMSLEDEAGETLVTGTTPGGAPVRYAVDAATLGVRAARIAPAGARETYTVRYGGYERYGTAFVPRRVVVTSEGGSLAMHAVAGELEVNGEIESSVFAEISE